MSGARRRGRALLAAAALLGAACPLPAQQVPPALARERADYAAWLARDPGSPWAARALQPIGTGLTLGPPGSDIELPGLALHRVREDGASVVLEAPSGSRPLPRGPLVPLGDWRLRVQGAPGRATLAVYGPPRPGTAPAFYAYDPRLVLDVTLDPPARRGTAPVLAPDGSEVMAAEAGSVRVEVGGQPATLRVRRLPGATPDESELLIYFRDGTAGQGSYLAGRFVELEPIAGDRYRLDFNRARNPFCAYSSIFPCPAPWPGNSIPAPVAAGEKYVPPAPKAG